MTRERPDEVPEWVHEYWTPTMRESEELKQVLREEEMLAEGELPDENMIYNVLCPQIRSLWSKHEEQVRRRGPHNATVPFKFPSPPAASLRRRLGKPHDH